LKTALGKLLLYCEASFFENHFHKIPASKVFANLLKEVFGKLFFERPFTKAFSRHL
jgi:hypothetical protein